MSQTRSFSLVTAPAIEPITIADLTANEFLKDIDLTDTKTKTLIETNCIPAARSKAENLLNRKLLTQTWKMTVDKAPSLIDFPFGQLQDVSHVKIYASDGTVTTQSASVYSHTTGDYAKLWLNSELGYLWTITTRPYASFEVQWTCGWVAAANIPMDIRMGIMRIVANLYYNREVLSDGLCNLFYAHAIAGV